MHTLSDYMDNIDRAANEGRLIQGVWSRNERGKNFVCLLSAVTDGVSSAKSCPSEVGPLWMREVLVRCHDGIAADQVVPMAKRLTATLRRAGDLTDTQWTRVRSIWLADVVDKAREAATPKTVAPAYWSVIDNHCRDVSEALRSGDDAKLTATTVWILPWSTRTRSK